MYNPKITRISLIATEKFSPSPIQQFHGIVEWDYFPDIIGGTLRSLQIFLARKILISL